jgi:hypothetical protein
MPTLRSTSLRALVAAIVAIGLLAPTVLAETEVAPCSGKCGTATAPDFMDVDKNQGATCNFADTVSVPTLSSIRVRPPKMFGRYSTKTKVQWRFQVMHFVEPDWVLEFTSTYQTAKASKTVAAYGTHGFTARTWPWSDDSDPFPTGSYRMRVQERWWHNGAVEGTRTVEYSWYKEIWNGGSDIQDHCQVAIE